MDALEQMKLLAGYNRWMNEKLYAACAELSPMQLDAERGAFFGSISGTLNHLAVGDRIWLQRFATHPACGEVLRAVAELPAPTGLDQRLFDDFAALAAHRRWLDGQILAWVAALVPADLDWPLDYRNTRGVAARRHYGALMLHFFNHQTHHRGQVTTLLTQLGQEVGVTDLLLLIPALETE